MVLRELEAPIRISEDVDALLDPYLLGVSSRHRSNTTNL